MGSLQCHQLDTYGYGRSDLHANSEVCDAKYLRSNILVRVHLGQESRHPSLGNDDQSARGVWHAVNPDREPSLQALVLNEASSTGTGCPEE